MYLKSILIHGFKSFAEKTTLEFLPPGNDGRLPIIGIVGPNGSGKSNTADAVRWVLGEQSVKAVRGKKSEDVIFAGSGKRARSSIAQVELTVINDDRRIPIDAQEVMVSRRLYRDGQSEYLLNGKTTRLMDIQMLLAKASFGKEGYSVIGQGQIDQILVATPEERKAFFDEATGVRPLQIKKEHSLKKLTSTEENLWQAQLLREELSPRLKSLTRQVKRLEQREELERELHELERHYYGTLLFENENEYKRAYDRIVGLQEALAPKVKELRTLEEEMRTLEKSETKPAEFLKIQENYEKLIATKQGLRDREFELKRKLLELKKDATAVPTHEIVAALEALKGVASGFMPDQSGTQGAALQEAVTRIKTIFTTISDLLSRLKGEATPKNAVALTAELETLGKELTQVDQELERLRIELQQVGQMAQEKKQSFFEVQKKLSTKQSEMHTVEGELNNTKIDLARVETRRDALDFEAKQELGGRYEMIKASLESTHQNPQILLPDIQRLKRQLESIGSIDQETIKEYHEVKGRFDFLETQINDLEASLESLVSLLEELDRTIKTQFASAFEKINTEFGNYFKILFAGGNAKLTKMVVEKEEEPDESGTQGAALQSIGVAGESTRQSLLDRFTKKDSYRGIDIAATPPGKKLKSITMLSGGEKAMTSIALLAAILSLNPPPFVMLDEVDAALDESNSARFASIIAELGGRTQFIVITHNRATMHACEVLYGVTMNDDGVSKILSLKFEEAATAVGSE
ncbi:MAG: AAA family ATPase [bacterium]|nr:AAA family ATPase [bacterium]